MAELWYCREASHFSHGQVHGCQTSKALGTRLSSRTNILVPITLSFLLAGLAASLCSGTAVHRLLGSWPRETKGNGDENGAGSAGPLLLLSCAHARGTRRLKPPIYEKSMIYLSSPRNWSIKLILKNLFQCLSNYHVIILSFSCPQKTITWSEPWNLIQNRLYTIFLINVALLIPTKCCYFINVILSGLGVARSRISWPPETGVMITSHLVGSGKLLYLGLLKTQEIPRYNELQLTRDKRTDQQGWKYFNPNRKTTSKTYVRTY